MIGFNALLREAGIDPADVKLVRHQDTRHPERPTPYELWTCADGRFDLYQKIQKRAVFKGAKFVASFVANPFDETLFVGLYRNKGVGKAKQKLTDPISGKNVGGFNFYDLVPNSRLKEYEGRLVIADREYTIRFFFHHKTLSQGDEVAFREIYPRFHRIAVECRGQIQGRIGRGMNTSATKVIDNAIVGFVRSKLKDLSEGVGTDRA